MLPIRVAQVIGRLYAAGVEAVVNNYYSFMDVSQIQFDYFIDDDSACEPSSRMIELGARYFVIPSSKKPVSRTLSLIRIFRKEKYSVVHAHLNTLNFPVLFAAWAAGVQVRISHNHSTADSTEGGRALIKWLLRSTAKWFATDLMACGEVAGRWMFGDRAFDAGCVRVLPNAIDLYRFRFDPKARALLRAELGIGERFVVGHVGRFVHQKNHRFLFEVFRELTSICPDAVLVLVGEGKLRAEMREWAEKEGIGASVHFLGIRNDMPAVYSAMDVFVLPSHYEGMPVVGWEAQANGLPCVFSDNVTREVDVAGRNTFLSLNDGCGRWAQSIARVAQENRREAADTLEGSRCDLRTTAPWLQGIYLQAAERKS